MEVVQGAIQEWQEFENASLAKANQKGKLGRVEADGRGVISACQPAIIINIASEVQFEVNRIGVGRLVSSVEKGVIQAESFVTESNQLPCLAELEAIKLSLIEANQQSIRAVEVRIDIKTIVA